jgi:uncharacterized membrane protein SpoIIM required for sporulation
MNLKRWVARREPHWQRLDRLLSQAEKRGLKSLSAAEIHDLASLYRSVSGDLARARTHAAGETLTRNLQSLTSRGYSQIYRGDRHQDWQAVRQFYRWGFPAAVRETGLEIAIATALLLGFGWLAWSLAWLDPQFMTLTVPPDLIEQVRDRGELWMGSIVGIEPLASSQIATNNLSVSFAAIGGGITAGLYTIFLMVYNGIHIGAIAALVAQYDLSYPFWAFVWPHGSLELPAIFFSGGAGLAIARGLLFPGAQRRAAALRIQGMKAARLTFGIVPMLLLAGAIEGFFSPNPYIPDAFKYLTGLGLLTLLIRYCLSGRSATPNLSQPPHPNTVASRN